MPPGLLGPDGRPSETRFAVYRNNVVLGLIQALGEAFPVVRRLVGENFFEAMAAEHVRQTPPTSPVMLEYGGEFACFISRFEPAAGLPYLEDVARLERAWVEAYHAAEALPLPVRALARIRAEDLPMTRFILHPSVRLTLSDFPVVSIWEANIEGGSSRLIDLGEGGVNVLISRPDAHVEMRTITDAAAAFIRALQDDAPVVEAVASALHAAPEFDLAAALTDLIEIGVIAGIITPSFRHEASL